MELKKKSENLFSEFLVTEKMKNLENLILKTPEGILKMLKIKRTDLNKIINPGRNR